MRNEKMNIKMTLMYDGTDYSGWQRLGNKDKLQSIQGVIEDTLSDILGNEIELIGSGRTDAGVHAYGQVANFHTLTKVDVKSLLGKLNQQLPDSIQILELIEVPATFHSRYDALAKIYEYHIDIRERQDVFTRRYRLGQVQQLDINKMKQGGASLVGKHDFKAFSSTMKDGRETIKTIDSIEYKLENQELILTVRGDGFLYNMVRILVGTLLEVGEGKRKPEEIETILLSRDRQKAGPTAPCQGLFLREVIYR